MKKQYIRCLILLFTALGSLCCLQGAWIPAKAILAQILLHTAWEESIQSGHPVKPWPWADTWPVARLHAPEYERDVIVLHGQQGESLAFGPGMLPAGAKPGQTGTCVLAGHRDTSFTFLEHITPGDSLILEDAGGNLWIYQVTSTMVRRAKNLFFNNSSGSQLALVTCYPFHAITPGTDKRFVVLAKLVDT